MLIDYKKSLYIRTPPPPPEFWGIIYCERGVRYGAGKCGRQWRHEQESEREVDVYGW